MFQAAMVSSAVNRANRLISYLQTVPIFSSLSPQMLDQLAKSMNKECFQDGEYIIRQGETGDKFYVLYRGRVRITKTKPESPLVETYMLTLKAGKGRRDEQRARSEASGDDGANSDILVEGDNELGCVFGERALLKRETRAANAVADGPVDAYSLDVTSFRLLLADVVDEMNQVNDLRVLRAAKLFAALSDRDLQLLLRSGRREVMYEGCRYINDDVKEEVVVVLGGSVAGAVKGELRAHTDANVVSVTYSMGDTIGSAAVSARHIASSLTARSQEVSLLFVETATLKRLEAADADADADTSADDAEDAERETKRDEDQYDDTTKSSPPSRRRSRGGMKARFGREPHGSSVSEAIGTPSMDVGACIPAAADDRSAVHCPSFLAHLTLQRVLCSGRFADTFLAHGEAKDASGTIALKAFSNVDASGQFDGSRRARREAARLQECMRREIHALSTLSHSFIAAFYGVAHAPSRTFVVMEFVSGGSLWTLIHGGGEGARGVFRGSGRSGKLSARAVAQYAAMACIALDYIHSAGLCYRNLRPENCLLTPDGYIKLIDFTFAKPVPFAGRGGVTQYRTFTFCGTADYLAPEVVLSQGHDRAVDLWALGVMVYEMMCGRPPFASGNEHETFQRICQARKHLSFPAGFDSDCRSLVRRLLHPNSALRLGNFSDGARAVRDHSFFAAHSVSFDAADRRQLALERVPLDQEDSTDRDGGVGAQDERLLQEAQSELRCVPAK